MKNQFIFIAALTCSPLLLAQEAGNDGVEKSGNMIAACQGLKAEDPCAIVGQLGVETGGQCLVDPRDGVLFCMPAGLPLEAVIGDKAAEVEPKPKG